MIYCFLLSVLDLYFVSIYRGVGLLGGLAHTTSTTQIFQIFIFFISSSIVLLTSFYPRKVWLSQYSSISKFVFHKFIFFSSQIINNITEQFNLLVYSFLHYIFYLVGNINKEKEGFSYSIPCVKDIYSLIYSAFTLCVLPLFYFNLYILNIVQAEGLSDITYYMLFIAGLWSCSGFYLIWLVGLNIYYKNNSNMCLIIIEKLIGLYLRKDYPFMPTKLKKKILIFISLSFLIFIGINILVLNILIYYLGINTNSLIIYVYIRLNLLPFMLYINNILASKITNYFTGNVSKIDYSLFSLNMFKSITLPRLFVMSGFICLFASISVNINDFILKMNNPSTGSNSMLGGYQGGNSGPGPSWNTGPGGNPPPGGNQGPSGNHIPSGNQGSSINPIPSTNTGQVVNTQPTLDSIKTKVLCRADKIPYRSIPLFSQIKNSRYDCNFTKDEIIFLTDKVKEYGLENSLPFSVLRFKKGEFSGIERVVRFEKGATENPSTSNTGPVRASVEFVNFLNKLT